MSHPTPKRTRAPKVFWTDAEMAFMVARAKEIQAAEPLLAKLPLLRKAMQSLPEKRWRTIIALSQVPWFVEGMTRSAANPALADGKLTEGLPAGHVLVPLVEQLLAEIRGLKEVVAALVSQAPSPSPSATKPIAPARMPRSLPPAPAPPRTMPPAPKPAADSRCRIAIVGPDAQQAIHIREKVGERAIVTILDRGAVGRRLPAADYFILTRHCSHDWWEKAKVHVGQSQVVRLDSGGVDRVVQKVYDLASRQRVAR